MNQPVSSMVDSVSMSFCRISPLSSIFVCVAHNIDLGEWIGGASSNISSNISCSSSGSGSGSSSGSGSGSSSGSDSGFGSGDE